MKMKTLQDLYVDCLRDLHSAEAQLVKALPKMAKAASSPDLREAIEHHLEETRNQVERLDRIFAKLGKRGTGKKCAAMEGLIEEGKELLEMEAEPDVLDAGLIGAAQRVEHYEMAAYGTVRTYAKILGDTKATSLLQETLDEEKAADQKLTGLAESINVKAAAAGSRRPTPRTSARR